MFLVNSNCTFQDKEPNNSRFINPILVFERIEANLSIHSEVEMDGEALSLSGKTEIQNL
jgi:hypothetical protein